MPGLSVMEKSSKEYVTAGRRGGGAVVLAVFTASVVESESDCHLTLLARGATGGDRLNTAESSSSPPLP